MEAPRQNENTTKPSCLARGHASPEARFTRQRYWQCIQYHDSIARNHCSTSKWHTLIYSYCAWLYGKTCKTENRRERGARQRSQRSKPVPRTKPLPDATSIRHGSQPVQGWDTESKARRHNRLPQHDKLDKTLNAVSTL